MISSANTERSAVVASVHTLLCFPALAESGEGSIRTSASDHKLISVDISSVKFSLCVPLEFEIK